MSKAKVFGFVVVIVIAIVITFLITRYAGPASSCGTQDKAPIPGDDSPKHTESHRLPTNVLPINYELKLQPFIGPSEFHFSGSVSILVTCKQATDVIQLNAVELEIDDQQVAIRSAGKNDSIKLSSLELKNEFLTLKLAKNLARNENYTVFIPFRGELTKSLNGFYLSTHVDPKHGETRYIAMTHFEPNSARRAFPCFDEPAMKATYEMEITHFQNMSALANMPSASEEKIDNDWTRTKFEKTVKMSSYLVAFAVGEFQFRNTEKPTKPQFRIVTRPGEYEHAKAAIEFGPSILAHYEQFFDYPFPLPKIDNLATPDFGLITYRESMVLYDEKYGSAEYKFVVCQTIAHELAHQWSGNLVTPKFWDDLWLNEGFADYMSYEGVHDVRPDWGIWQRFVIDEVQHVMTLDSLKSSHPISVKVNSPEEAEELFDLISYEKGASVIRMLAEIIGRETFREGMHNYLEAFKFSNADQNDLWRFLQAAYDGRNGSAVDLTQMMESWTLQEGYPLVTVTRDYATGKTVRFSQKRFLLNSDDEEALVRTQYQVPITYTTKGERDFKPTTKLWLNKTNSGESSAVVDLSIPKGDWIIANLQESGYYRVNYDEKNWNLLVDQLLTDHTQIDQINRAQILDDLFRLAENGVVRYSLALRALEYLKKETEVLPWLSFEAFIKPINRLLSRTEVFGDWKNFIRELVQGTYERMATEDYGDEDLKNGKLQRVIAIIACNYDLASCVTKSSEQLKELMQNSTDNPVPPNLRAAVYCTAIAYGDKSTWDFMFESYLKVENANEEKELIKALACARAPWIQTHLLNLAFNESSGVRKQDVVFVFRAFKESNFEFSRDVVLNYLLENWQHIHQLHGQFKTFGEIVDLFDAFSTRSELATMENLYRSIGSKIGRSKRSFLQTLDKIRANMRWMEKNLDEIASYFKERNWSKCSTRSLKMLLSCLRSCLCWLLWCSPWRDTPEANSETSPGSEKRIQSPTKKTSGRNIRLKKSDQSLYQLDSFGSGKETGSEQAQIDQQMTQQLAHQMSQQIEQWRRSPQRASERSMHRRRQKTIEEREKQNKLDGQKQRTSSHHDRMSRRKRRSRYRKHRSRSPSAQSKRREEQPAMHRAMKEESYDKPVPTPGDQYTIPNAGYKFVFDTYTPTVQAQPHAQPDVRPIMQHPMSPDQSDSSAKSPEKSAADLNDKDDDKSSILSRQIPIIKVIGDLQDVSTLTIQGKIPTYKSDGLNEPKLKMINKDVFKHFDKELNVLALKRELNEQKRNLDFVKEIKQKRRPDDESEDESRPTRLEKNLAILKEANLDQGPRKIEFKPSLRKVKSVPKLKRKESKSDLLVIFKSDQSLKSLKKSLESRKGSSGSADKGFDKNDSEMSHKSVQSNSSQSFGSSGAFNVNSQTKIRRKDGSNSSISMINPFNSLRMFIRRDLKDVFPMSEKRRMMARNYLKDDFLFKDLKQRKSMDRGSLLSVITAISSGEKVKIGHKSDPKDEKKVDKIDRDQKLEKEDQSLREDKKPEKEDEKDGKDGKDGRDEKSGKDEKPEVR